jgi:ribonuclease HII
MAGPIVVATVIMNPDFFDARIKDSKKISAKLREELYQLIMEQTLDVQVEIFSALEVDQLNPKQASILGMKNSIRKLSQPIDCALVDGEVLKDFDQYNPITLIKGDSLSFSIACASIIAKVSRDRIMEDYAKIYPGYGFEKHKGYVTKFHQEQVHQLGVLPIHRQSYRPIKEILKNNKKSEKNLFF